MNFGMCYPGNLHLFANGVSLLLVMSQKLIISLGNEVLSQCSSENVPAPIDLCVYLLELKLLQLSVDISTVSRDATLADTIIKQCVTDLKENSLSLYTLKLQLFWKKKYKHRDEIKKIHHERVFKNILPLMSEIAEEGLTKPVDKDRLCKKIVIFIIMYAGLGSPTQESIIKETQAALNSIFKAPEVDNFLSLSKATKEQQLIEFARLITGIMLFTKDCKKGGEGMDDLPLILTQGAQATKDRLISFKDQLEQKIDAVVDTLQGGSRFKHESEPNSDLQKEALEEYKSLLIYYRQIEHCLNDLIMDLERSFVIIEELIQRLQATLLQVHSVVRYRVAVATMQVFPLFLQLSNVWVEMQEEVDILSEINNNFVDLSTSPRLKAAVSQPQKRSPSTERMLPSKNLEIHDCSDFYPGVKVCSITSGLSVDHFQYKGFCAWTLAYSEGLLISGNIALGVIQFFDRYYIFSSADAALKWALNPTQSIQKVLQLARDKPELIKFLSLEEDLVEKQTIEEHEKPTTVDSEMQTELHPLESFISKEYTFSEWELKKRALKLATLTRCATKSQQTAGRSCFRTEAAVQVSLCKSTSTQTARDGFCNHPSVPRSAWHFLTKPSQFLLPDSESDAIKVVKK